MLEQAEAEMRQLRYSTRSSLTEGLIDIILQCANFNISESGQVN
jgi:hypothetical protein